MKRLTLTLSSAFDMWQVRLKPDSKATVTNRVIDVLLDRWTTTWQCVRAPKEERDLLVQGACNRCVALDNLSSLPLWLSNGLCRLSTGGGHSARELYTDLEEISIAVKRPVILNGIQNVATPPDLAERVLQIELETIPDAKRISEKDLW